VAAQLAERLPRPAGVLLALGLLLAGCAPPAFDTAQLLPAGVGDFARTEGPAYDAESGVDFASYSGAQGGVTLRVRQVDPDEVETALAGLPAGATEIGDDPALGERQGVFFAFSDEYHAAWANGDWVFILSATSDEARRAFLASYGF
jgi:hypothetical protein